MALIAPPNAQYSFASPRRQLLSFPQDVISRMLNNPSSHIGLMKLYQTCKYFWSKRPILIVDGIECIKKVPDEEGNELPVGHSNLTHSQAPFWITTRIVFENYRDQRLPKLFRSSVKTIFMNGSDLHFDDFVLLAAEKNVTIFHPCIKSYLYHSDKSKVTIDQVLVHLPIVRFFAYIMDEKCSREILTKLNEIKLKNKLEYLDLEIKDVHPTFDLDIFYQFIVNNCNAETEMALILHPEAQEKLSVPLAKMDSKWRMKVHYSGKTKLVLKDDLSSDEKEMKE